MKRKPRTQDELRKASEHLHYEIWMLRSLAQGLASGTVPARVINNALLESFAIHTRVLMEAGIGETGLILIWDPGLFVDARYLSLEE